MSLEIKADEHYVKIRDIIRANIDKHTIDQAVKSNQLSGLTVAISPRKQLHLFSQTDIRKWNEYSKDVVGDRLNNVTDYTLGNQIIRKHGPNLEITPYTPKERKNHSRRRIIPYRRIIVPAKVYLAQLFTDMAEAELYNLMAGLNTEYEIVPQESKDKFSGTPYYTPKQMEDIKLIRNKRLTPTAYKNHIATRRGAME